MFDSHDSAAEAALTTIRRVGRNEAGRIAAFVNALDRDTLQVRFGRSMSAAAIEAHYAGLDWDGAVLLAWVTEPAISGLVEVFPFPSTAAPRPGAIEAEIALVVAPGCRGRGIGRRLLATGIAAAGGLGAVRSTMLLAARDHALARLARRLGFTHDGADQIVFVHEGAPARA